MSRIYVLLTKPRKMAQASRPESVVKLLRPIAVSLLAAGLVQCKRDKAPEPAPSATAEAPSSADPPASASAAPPVEAPAPTTPDPKMYAWLADADAPKATSTLQARFETPPGYKRVKVEEGSFGAWLRTLPMAAEDTPVKTYKGQVIHEGDDQYLAGVVAIDVGNIDLQQSPDVVLRLHAEWLWSQGVRDMTYRGATGLDMPFSRWIRGERIMAQGASVFWVVKAKPVEPDHGELRKYLDTVFTWANSTSLSQQAESIDGSDLRPGDFFVHTGSPGHAVILLDIAEKPSGQRVALLGQGLNPAQNVFVPRPGRATPWFSLRKGEAIITPHTKEFTWDGLRRLGKPAAE